MVSGLAELVGFPLLGSDPIVDWFGNFSTDCFLDSLQELALELEENCYSSSPTANLGNTAASARYHC